MDGSSNLATPVVDQLPDAEQQKEYHTQAADRELGISVESSLQSIEVAWLLWGRRRFLAQMTVRGLIFFTILAFLWPKSYTATTSLMPPDYNTTSDLTTSLPALIGSGETSGGSGSIMGLASQLLGFNTSGDLLIGVLGSSIVEDRIVSRFKLMELYSTRYPEDARKRLEGITDLSQDRKSGIIAISVEDKDPRRAAAIAQAYVDELDRLLAQVNTSSAHRERVFIEERLGEVKKELDSAAKEFSEFSSKNSAINIPEQAKAMVAAAADLQAQLISAQAELKALQQVFTDQNVRVRSAKAQIAELQSQINKFGGKDVTLSNGTSLADGELYPSVRQLPLIGVKYLDLYRRSKIDEEVFALLTKEYEVAKVEEAREVPSVQVLDPANVPQKKSSPHRLRIMLAGMCASLVLGIACILGGEYWERLDPQRPWKVFAREVFMTIRVRTWDSRAGTWICDRVVGFVARVPILRRFLKPKAAFPPSLFL